MNAPIEVCLASLKEDNGPFSLSSAAGCAGPDTTESAGAEFLVSIRDSVIDGLEYALSDHLAEPDVLELDIESIVHDIEEWFDSGGHEIADGAPSIYTFTRWNEFVDLAAWQEEPEITGEWPGDLSEAAGLALYQIADRLAHALKQEFIKTLTNTLSEAQEDAEADA